METKDIILELRTKLGLSQEALAEQVFVTRQAVSRWETGETLPNTETLKLLSKLFDVSINTLLGSPRHLICQCCGMPLEDERISREQDGAFNEAYCKWCYADGHYVYDTMDTLIDTCASHMVSEACTEEQAKAYLRDMLPRLDHWKPYAALGGEEAYNAFKQKLMDEVNALAVEGMPKVTELRRISGSTVDPMLRLPSGEQVRFLSAERSYLGAKLPSEFGGERLFFVVADMDFILIFTAEADVSHAEPVIYKQR